ncbi:UrcA family protein [Pelagerythrobacter rhizovicinus]|nr:UrcA family protein [Pelagerythrobacter rhizovicinus]
MKRHLVALTAAAVLGAAATPAFAESLSIPYQDLNLATAEGQKTLDLRIEKAVRDFCAMNPRTGSRIISGESRQCYAEMKKQVQTQFAAIVDRQRLGG